MDRPQPIRGEVISFHRFETPAGVFNVLAGPCISLGGIAVLVITLIEGSAGSELATVLVTAPLIVLIGVLAFWVGMYGLTHKARLVLGHDRLQYLAGRCVVWEVHYDDISQVAVFTSRAGASFVGIRLTAPDRLAAWWPGLQWLNRRSQTRWKQWGFDLALPSIRAHEPADRVVEACLRCVHRFRATRGEEGPDQEQIANAIQ